MVSDLVTSVRRMSKTPKWIFTYSNGVVCCVTNRNPIVLIFREIYRFAIYINPQDPFSHRTFNYIYSRHTRYNGEEKLAPAALFRKCGTRQRSTYVQQVCTIYSQRVRRSEVRGVRGVIGLPGYYQFPHYLASFISLLHIT